MKCKVTQQTIENHVYKTVLSHDPNASMQDGVITCTSEEAYNNAVSEIRALEKEKLMSEESGPIIGTNDEKMTIEVLENQEVLSDYSTQENQTLRTTLGTSSMPQYKTNQVDNKYVDKWKSKLYNTRRTVENEIKALNDRMNKQDTASISDEELEEIHKQHRLLVQLRNEITRQINETREVNVRVAIDELMNIVQIGLDSMQNLLSDENISTLTLEQIGIIRNIVQTNEYIISNYFSQKHAVSTPVTENGITSGPDVSLNDEQTLRANEQHSQFNLLKERYNQYLANKQMQYIRTNGLLMQKFGADFMSETYQAGKSNAKRKRFETLFGGAEMADKGFLEYMGLNIDRSFTSDSVLEQLLQIEMDTRLTDRTQFAYGISERLVDLGKKLKKHGINIETWSGSSFLREKDEHGKETGKLSHAFSVGFQKKFKELNTMDVLNAIARNKGPETARKRAQFIKDNFDIIDFTRLADFTEDEQMRGMIENLAEGMPVSFSTDIRYTEELKQKLGPCYNEIITNFKNKIRNHFMESENLRLSGTTDEKEIMEIKAKNPVMMALKIKEMQNKTLLTSEDYTISIRIGGQVRPVKFYLEFGRNCMTYIPKNDSDYNMEFRNSFCGTDNVSKLRRELYETFSDLYREVNLTYNGRSDARYYAKLAPDFIDNFDDAKTMPEKGKMLMKSTLEKCKEHLYNEHYFNTDEESVSKNYLDIQKQKYEMFLNMLQSGMSKEDIDRMAKEVEIKRDDYESDEEYIKAIAREHSMHCFSKNMLKSATNMAYLYAAQKAREDVFEIAKMIQNQYNTYQLNGKEGGRETANKQMQNWIQRVIQKVETKSNITILDKKVKDVMFLRMLMEKSSESSVIQKILRKTLTIHMDDEEKRVYKEFQKLLDGFDKTKEFEFRYKGVTYRYDPQQADDKKFSSRKSKSDDFMALGNDGEATFNQAYNQYLTEKMDSIGKNVTFNGILELVQSLIIFKALAGISSSGLFNRVEGQLAAAEADASAYYWTPGNLAKAERLFFGAGLHRYVNENGDPKFFPDSKGAKRRRILQIIADRSGIFQDMKNQFDKTIDTSPGTTMSHNLDLYQLSVTNPEFKNQMTMCVACMFDLTVMDNNGILHPFINDNGEFTLYDIKDGKLVLKEGFDMYNKEWIDFQMIKDKEVSVQIGRSVSKKFYNTHTDISKFITKQKWMISTIQGDYRKTSCVGYTNSALMRQMMILKRWYPAKVYRAWNPGKGVNIAMENVDKEGVVTGKDEEDKYVRKTQSGKYGDMVLYGGVLTTALPFILSAQKLDKGIVKTATNVGVGLYLGCKTIKTRLQTGKIGENAGLISTDLEFLKNLLFEFVFFMPRTIFKRDSMFGTKSNEVGFQNQGMVRKFGELRLKKDGVKKEDFLSDEEYENALNQYGNIIVGNFRSVARETAAKINILCISLIAKAILWDPDDGDDDDRRMYYNWVDNNVSKILQSTSDCMYMLNSMEDKYSIDSIPIVRWVNDASNFVVALNKWDTEKMAKYGFRSLPLPRGIIYDGNFTLYPFSPLDPFDIFKSSYEYTKDEWSDKVVKNIKTHGEYAWDQQYKKYRDEAVRAYMKKVKKKKFTAQEQAVIKEYLKRNNYKENSIYDLDDKKAKNVIRNAFLPNKSKKPFMKMTSKEMVEEYKKFFDEKDLTYSWFRVYHNSPNRLGIWERFDNDNDNDEE